MDMYSAVRNRVTIFALASALLGIAPAVALAETGTPPQQAAAPGQQTAFSTTQAAPAANAVETGMPSAAEDQSGIYDGPEWQYERDEILNHIGGQ